MELVDRVQVAAGKAVQKERDAGRERRREEEVRRNSRNATKINSNSLLRSSLLQEDIERAEHTVKKFKKACEKLTSQNRSYKQRIERLQTQTGNQSREISILRGSNDSLKDELSNCKIQLARYEER